jgi:hypothetical protein
MKSAPFFKFRYWAKTLYILLFCSLGFYLYPSADDYVFRSLLRDQGFWQSQILLYTSWTGRWFNTFLVLMASQTNMTLLLWITAAFNIISLYALFSEASPKLHRVTKAEMALLSQAVWFSFVPALNEIFYWLSGMPYTWTAAFSLLCLATLIHILRSKKRKMSFYLLFLSVFFNGLILETMCITQIVVLFFLVLYFMSRKDRFSAQTAGAVLGAAIAGFLVLYLSPGTAVRMGGGGGNIIQTLGVAAIFGGVTAVKFFTKPIVYLMILYMPVIAAHLEPFDKKISARLRAWHIVILVGLIAPFQQAIAGWAQGAGLPARAEGLAIWLMGAAWVFLWAFGYRNDAVFEKIRSLRIYPRRGVLLALCLVLNFNFVALIQDLRVAPLYATEQRQREASILRQKEKSKTDIVVPTLTVKPKLLFFTDLRPSPNDWKNRSFAEYWGVHSVSALPKEVLHDERARRDFQEEKPAALEALALTGDVEVQFMLGEIYDTTFAALSGTPKDNAAAAKWYRMAADQGYAPAQRRLTRLCALGMGVPKNYFCAVGWFLRSQF